VKIIQYLSKNEIKKPVVVSIGNFDGIHKGHQHIINSLIKKAKRHNAYSTIICFEPQTREFFLQEKNLPRITPLRNKIITICKRMIDQIICIKFNKKFSRKTGEDFILKFLVNTLNTKHIIIGDDFHFGYQRQINHNNLDYYGKKYGFTISKVHKILNKSQRISSSRIRLLIKRNKFSIVHQLLGQKYNVRGKVYHGTERGRKISFPTVNVALIKNTALQGVYIVHVLWKKNTYYGIANIGINPTLGKRKKLIEIYIFNFCYFIYGENINIEFLKFLRYEKKFTHFAELKIQITVDKLMACDWIRKNHKL